MSDYQWETNANAREQDEDDYYSRARPNEYEGHSELNAEVPAALGEEGGQHGAVFLHLSSKLTLLTFQVHAQINVLTPELVAQAPEVLDDFAGAPVDFDLS